jgi:hypothetical protein
VPLPDSPNGLQARHQDGAPAELHPSTGQSLHMHQFTSWLHHCCTMLVRTLPAARRAPSSSTLPPCPAAGGCHSQAYGGLPCGGCGQLWRGQHSHCYHHHHHPHSHHQQQQQRHEPRDQPGMCPCPQSPSSLSLLLANSTHTSQEYIPVTIRECPRVLLSWSRDVEVIQPGGSVAPSGYTLLHSSALRS